MSIEHIHQLRNYADTRLNGVPLIERRRVVAVAVGRGMSTRLPLPSSPVVSPNLYYNQTYDSQISEWVSKINEYYQLDVNLVRDTAYMYWKLAYDLCYDRTRMMGLLNAFIAIHPDTVPTRIQELVNATAALKINVEEDISVMINCVTGYVDPEISKDVGEF